MSHVTTLIWLKWYKWSESLEMHYREKCTEFSWMLHYLDTLNINFSSYGACVCNNSNSFPAVWMGAFSFWTTQEHHWNLFGSCTKLFAYKELEPRGITLWAWTDHLQKPLLLFQLWLLRNYNKIIAFSLYSASSSLSSCNSLQEKRNTSLCYSKIPVNVKLISI